MTPRSKSEERFSISVIIPHLNQPEALARCLSSLMDDPRQPDEIIVVDNGSKSLPEAVVAAYPNTTLLAESTPGPGPARNLGVAHAKGDIFAFIDADCLAGDGWLSQMEAQFLAEPNLGILGGNVCIAYVDAAQLTVLEAYESIYAYRMDRYIAREGFTGTGNLAVRRAVMEKVGTFAGLEIAEDRDWGQRATGMGYEIRYMPDMIAYHPAREKFTDLATKWDRQTAHDFTSAKLRRGGWLRFAIKTGAMALSPIAEIPRIIGSDRIKGAGDRWLAFRGLVRIRLYRTWIMLRLLCGADPLRFSGSWNRS